ncbi:ERMES complex subunit [Claviceps sorghi]|nr:ERMES complex subunit [Claviceps sorghi]
MAFNFNWSPLTADADFYSRARHLLTKALNKSPKPPIIVDDILVSEFNLGTVPPDLEILEIGDLAEDRFRGIFKMCYSGDAFLTLKTRVQANPLNTYLDSKPSFTSPQPLAAASGLTIPLSITLSDIKLSAFIILVFSKQKGLTLVFRNDPLESLKVSSTFDSIQFVRDYLQRTIEQQLRNLMMDELPAIIHRLSLELLCPDQANKGTRTPQEDVDEMAINPLASPPLDPVDVNGNLLDYNTVSELALNGGGEAQSLFSQKNLVRLATLTDSHRTLSLFTPGIKDVVFRAWSGIGDRSDLVSPPFATPSLARKNSFAAGGSTTYTFSDSGSTAHGSSLSRPSLISLNSAVNGISHNASSHRSRPSRKKKTRVVNLRKTKSEVGSSEPPSEAVSDTASISVPASEPVDAMSMPDDCASEHVNVNGGAPAGQVRFRHPHMDHPVPIRQALMSDLYKRKFDQCAASARDQSQTDTLPAGNRDMVADKMASGKNGKPLREPYQASGSSDTSSVILEQAWIMKMADEIARRVYDEKQGQQGTWEHASDTAPPAYEAASH